MKTEDKKRFRICLENKVNLSGYEEEKKEKNPGWRLSLGSLGNRAWGLSLPFMGGRIPGKEEWGVKREVRQERGRINTRHLLGWQELQKQTDDCRPCRPSSEDCIKPVYPGSCPVKGRREKNWSASSLPYPVSHQILPHTVLSPPTSWCVIHSLQSIWRSNLASVWVWWSGIVSTTNTGCNSSSSCQGFKAGRTARGAGSQRCLGLTGSVLARNPAELTPGLQA